MPCSHGRKWIFSIRVTSLQFSSLILFSSTNRNEYWLDNRWMKFWIIWTYASRNNFYGSFGNDAFAVKTCQAPSIFYSHLSASQSLSWWITWTSNASCLSSSNEFQSLICYCPSILSIPFLIPKRLALLLYQLKIPSINISDNKTYWFCVY